MDLVLQFRHLPNFLFLDLIPVANNRVYLCQKTVDLLRGNAISLLDVFGLIVSFNFWVEFKKEKTCEDLLVCYVIQLFFITRLLPFALFQQSLVFH